MERWKIAKDLKERPLMMAVKVDSVRQNWKAYLKNLQVNTQERAAVNIIVLMVQEKVTLLRKGQ